MDVGEIEVKREIIFGDEPTSPHSQYTLGSPQVDLGEEESCEGNADDDQYVIGNFPLFIFHTQKMELLS